MKSEVNSRLCDLHTCRLCLVDPFVIAKRARHEPPRLGRRKKKESRRRKVGSLIKVQWKTHESNHGPKQFVRVTVRRVLIQYMLLLWWRWVIACDGLLSFAGESRCGSLEYPRPRGGQSRKVLRTRLSKRKAPMGLDSLRVVTGI